MNEQAQTANDGVGGIHANRLFTASCFSLISTAVCFAVIGAIMGDLKQHFVLSNEQVGYIVGGGFWGFTIAIFILGPLCNTLGMKNLMRLAWLCHLIGVLVMIFAVGFWSLLAGALILALGNGTVEAACNPLVVTLFHTRKTQKLNQFHVWFPGGIAIGGLLCFAIGKSGLGSESFALWQMKLIIIMIPTFIYGVLFLGQSFPKTERVQSNINFGEMLTGALGRPLFWLLLLCMCITASLELGPNRWIPAVLESGGMPGILALVYISALMAILRLFAGPLVHRLSPTGILVSGAILAGIGLYWFSFADSMVMYLASATVFAVGICYFWPTMLGMTSERVPKSGEFGLALMGGMGMFMVGIVTTPQMGVIIDTYLHQQLEAEPAKVVMVIEGAVTAYPALAENMPELFKKEIDGAISDGQAIITAFEKDQKLPAGDTSNALRALVANAPKPEGEPDQEQVKKLTTAIDDVLKPADNYGGRVSFRYVAPFAGILIVVFGLMFIKDKAAGGYKAEKIGQDLDE